MPSLALLFATAPARRSRIGRSRCVRATLRATRSAPRATGTSRHFRMDSTTTGCGLFAQHGQRLVGRCVDCHMPGLTSTVISGSVVGRELRVQVRTHWIKVYPLAQPVAVPYDSGRP